MEGEDGPDVEFDDESGVYRAEYDRTRHGRLSTAVVEVVSTAVDRDPTEWGPLYRWIDPEALDALFAPRVDGTPRHEGWITLPLPETTVTVAADGTITVVPDE